MIADKILYAIKLCVECLSGDKLKTAIQALLCAYYEDNVTYEKKIEELKAMNVNAEVKDEK